MKLQKAIIVLSIPFILCISGYTTTMMELSLQDLATGSEMIVQAKVTAIVKQWNSDKSCIYTYIRMNIIDDLITNEEDNEIIIKQPGGSIGGTTLIVEGVSHYKVGEENIVFLFTDPNNLSAFQTLGMYQGRYEIYIDQEGVRRVRQETNSQVKLLKESGLESMEKGNDLPLDEFKATVLSLLNGSDK